LSGYGNFIGFFFSMITIGINYLYQRRSWSIWLIAGFCMIIRLGIADLILGVWREFEGFILSEVKG
jgi:hypothetical protein